MSQSKFLSAGWPAVGAEPAVPVRNFSRRPTVEEKERRAIPRPYGSRRRHLAVERMRVLLAIDSCTGW